MSRVLYIAHYVALLGANRSLLNLLQHRKSVGAESCVIVPCTGELTTELDKLGVEYRVVDHRSWYHVPSNRNNILLKGVRRLLNQLKARKNWAQNQKVAPEILAYAQERKIDIIHSNSVTIPVGQLISDLSGIPHIWHLREFGETDYHMHPDKGSEEKLRWLRKADQLICVSSAVKDYHCQGVDHATVIHNGVMTADQALQSRHQPTERFSCVIVGYLSETKGQHEAIEAVIELNARGYDIGLVVVGKGVESYMTNLRQLVREQGAEDYITFTGQVDDAALYFMKSDVTLMCSRNEGMGRVTAEAMLCESVVVGYDSGGTSELIEHGVTGVLYTGGTEELVAAIESLLNNPEKRSVMRREIKAYAMQNYTAEIYAQKVEKIYEVILNKSN